MAEFFKNCWMVSYYLMTFCKWIKSLKTTSKTYFLDDAVNNEPAYLPATVSAMAGGLCPLINIVCTGNRLHRLNSEHESSEIQIFT
jgi:hypothetical protein